MMIQYTSQAITENATEQFAHVVQYTYTDQCSIKQETSTVCVNGLTLWDARASACKGMESIMIH